MQVNFALKILLVSFQENLPFKVAIGKSVASTRRYDSSCRKHFPREQRMLVSPRDQQQTVLALGMHFPDPPRTALYQNSRVAGFEVRVYFHSFRNWLYVHLTLFFLLPSLTMADRCLNRFRGGSACSPLLDPLPVEDSPPWSIGLPSLVSLISASLARISCFAVATCCSDRRSLNLGSRAVAMTKSGSKFMLLGSANFLNLALSSAFRREAAPLSPGCCLTCTLYLYYGSHINLRHRQVP